MRRVFNILLAATYAVAILVVLCDVFIWRK